MFRDEDSPNSQELTKFSPLVEFVNVMEYYQARKMVFDYRNIKKRVENTTHSGVFPTNFEVFGNVVKHISSQSKLELRR